MCTLRGIAVFLIFAGDDVGWYVTELFTYLFDRKRLHGRLGDRTGVPQNC